MRLLYAIFCTACAGLIGVIVYDAWPRALQFVELLSVFASPLAVAYIAYLLSGSLTRSVRPGRTRRRGTTESRAV